MNKERRKELRRIVVELEQLQSDLETVAAEERDAFDSVGENLQQTDRVREWEDNADKLDDAVSVFEEIIDAINEVV